MYSWYNFLFLWKEMNSSLPKLCCCSVTLSCLTLQPHGLQHARFPCPSLSPVICSHSFPLSRWCCLTISFSVIPYSCSQSFPAMEPLPVNWLFASGGQSIRASASASVLSSEYSGLMSFRMGWFDLLALQETLKSLLQHYSLKASILWCSVFFMFQLSIYTWLLEKPYIWLYGPLLRKWCLCF